MKGCEIISLFSIIPLEEICISGLDISSTLLLNNSSFFLVKSDSLINPESKISFYFSNSSILGSKGPN